MIWNNKCRKMRRLLALWAGNDLDERDATGLERHLASCPHCREVRQGLHRSQRALEAVRPGTVLENQQSASVWPGVARHVRSIDENSVPQGWREWLPTAALAAACVAMMAALIPTARSGDGRSTSIATSRPSQPGSPRLQQWVGSSPTAPWGSADPDSYRNF
jgi:hypothetical protein